MKKQGFILTLLLFCISQLFAQFPEHINVLDIEVNKTKVFSGSLSEGKFTDLRFGTRGGINCFTAEQKRYFDGHHVLYAFDVPANTKVLIELNTRADMSLYGYSIDASLYNVPPDLEKIGKSGCGSSMKGPGELDRIMIKAGSVKSHIVFGVTGIDEAREGSFTVKIVTKS